ncbi:hypothetical protein V2J09_021724 [Rumex salicifolius]
MERYEVLKDLGSGNFGVAKLVKDKQTGDLFAVKYIERGKKIDEHVQREIMNHRALKHPNIIRFKEVFLTPTHLAIVMEYAAGGELFERICTAGRFSEDEAKYFFLQLISGVSYCHSMSSVLHSQPKSTVGTPAYIAPEVLSKKEYDGKIADVWSCGVTLYVMLVGAYPFEDPEEPRNFKKTIGRILSAHFSIPDYVRISPDCKHLLSRIFVANPEKGDNETEELCIEDSKQRVEDILPIVEEARTPPQRGLRLPGDLFGGSMDLDDLEADADIDDMEASGDFVCVVRSGDDET